MRILLTVASLRPETGGPARSVPGLANALVNQGLEVHVWSPDVPAVPTDPVGFVLHRGTLEETLNQIKPLDLIHDNGLWLPMNHRIAMAAKRRGIPRIVSPRGMLEPWALNQKKWKKRLAWWLYQRRDLQSASALHATAESESGQFKRLGLHAAVRIIPNGVDVVKTEKLKSEKLKGETRTALFLSRVHPKKGLPLLLEAWAKVRPENWNLHVVGPDEGGHRAELENQVVMLGLGDSIRFSGPLTGDAKAAVFRESSLFILPTHSENFGIAVAEAMAHGLPVITTHGTPWKLLEEKNCGWWTPISTDGIAAALDDATRRSPEELAAMGERGRTVVEERFAWEGIARQFVECYEWVLGGGDKPCSVV